MVSKQSLSHGHFSIGEIVVSGILRPHQLNYLFIIRIILKIEEGGRIYFFIF